MKTAAGEESAVDVLLEKVPELLADVESGGNTALHLAAREGNEKVGCEPVSLKVAVGLPLLPSFAIDSWSKRN